MGSCRPGRGTGDDSQARRLDRLVSPPVKTKMVEVMRQLPRFGLSKPCQGSQGSQIVDLARHETNDHCTITRLHRDLTASASAGSVQIFVGAAISFFGVACDRNLLPAPHMELNQGELISLINAHSSLQGNS